jgi:hypothetical protein
MGSRPFDAEQVLPSSLFAELHQFVSNGHGRAFHAARDFLATASGDQTALLLLIGTVACGGGGGGGGATTEEEGCPG